MFYYLCVDVCVCVCVLLYITYYVLLFVCGCMWVCGRILCVYMLRYLGELQWFGSHDTSVPLCPDWWPGRALVILCDPHIYACTHTCLLYLFCHNNKKEYKYVKFISKWEKLKQIKECQVVCRAHIRDFSVYHLTQHPYVLQ